MQRFSSSPALLLVIGCALGCAATNQESLRTSSKVHPAQATTHPIDIYRSGQAPDYPYEEVGIVSADKRAGSAFGSAHVTQLIPIIQDQARNLGGDAIIIRDASEYMSPSLNGSLTIPAAYVSGVAIRYIRPSAPATLVLAPDTGSKPAGIYSAQQIAAMATPSIVQIETETGQGSGFVVASGGLILTNDHVVRRATAIIVKTVGGRRSRAVIQASDSLADVALLKVALDSLIPARLGRLSGVFPGQDVVAIGSPLGLSQSLSRGIVSSVRLLNGLTYIQTDAAVSPGNSGGPLFNDHAEVIGIVTFKMSTRLAEGLGFALSIDDALKAVGLVRN